MILAPNPVSLPLPAFPPPSPPPVPMYQVPHRSSPRESSSSTTRSSPPSVAETHSTSPALGTALTPLCGSSCPSCGGSSSWCSLRSRSYFYTSASRIDNRDHRGLEEWIVGQGNSEFLREAVALANVLECTCQMTSTSCCDLVCEITCKVVDDYGATRREILRCAREMGDRIDWTLTDDDTDTDDVGVDESGRVLERLRDCEAKARVVFGNKRNYDGLWETLACANNTVAVVAKNRRSQKSIVKYAESNGGGIDVALRPGKSIERRRSGKRHDHWSGFGSDSGVGSIRLAWSTWSELRTEILNPVL